MTAEAWIALGVGAIGILSSIGTNVFTYGRFSGRVIARLDNQDKKIGEVETDLKEHKDRIWEKVDDVSGKVEHIRGVLGINGGRSHGKGAGIV